jgi:hypothetical protein
LTLRALRPSSRGRDASEKHKRSSILPHEDGLGRKRCVRTDEIRAGVYGLSAEVAERLIRVQVVTKPLELRVRDGSHYIVKTLRYIC